MGENIRSVDMRITKRFGKTTVLDDFRLDIAGGEFVTLLGPSGCGKTTALNCIAGLIDVTAGEIKIDEKRIDNIPTEKRGIGLVFQNYALFPHLSVSRNVAFGLEIQKRTPQEIKTRVQDMLSLVRLGGYGDRYPGQLSGGQQQRVAIARALALQPRLMLFDEPLSNLDSKLRTDMRAEIKNLHNRLGLTSVYVTHDQTEALSLSDKVVVMKSGIIQQIGTPKQVYETPSNLFVADFMGFRNFFDATIVEASPSAYQAKVKGLEQVFTVKPTGQWRVGEDVILAIRPEDVTLAAPEETTTAGGNDNVVNGRVRLIEYLGLDNSIDVELGGGKTVWVRTNVAAAMNAPVAVVLNPERIVVLPPQS